MNIQIKYRKVQNEKSFNREYRRILHNSNDGDNHEEKLSIQQDAEIIGYSITHIQCVPHHEPDYCKKRGAGEYVVNRVLFRYENDTKYSSKEDENCDERPPTPIGRNDTSLVFIKHGEPGHDNHACCDEMSCLECTLEGILIFHDSISKEGFLAGDDAGYAECRPAAAF